MHRILYYIATFILMLIPLWVSAQTVSVGGTVESRVSAEKSTVTVTPLEQINDGVSLVTITVTLRDANNTALPNLTVLLTSSRGAADFVGVYNADNLTKNNTGTSNANGVVMFGSYSSTVGQATYTALADSQVTLKNKPTVTFKEKVTVDDEPNIINPPIDPPKNNIEKVVDFFQENIPETNNTIAAVSTITALTLLPTVTTSIITAMLQNIPILNFLLTSWLPIKRKRKWGTIRDKKTGVPIAGVEVQLFTKGTPEPLLKYRTDQTGQYGFLIDRTGEYYLNIANPLYHSYKSDIFSITDLSQVVSIDIPLISDEAQQVKQTTKARKYMDRVRYLNYFSVIMISVGSIVSIYAFYTTPNLVAGFVLGLYAVIWSVKLYHYANYRYYGLVVDTPSDKPIKTAIIQLTGKKQGVQALVHSTITDSKGRFLFIVKPSRYSMIAAKTGYEPAEAEVNDQRVSKTIKLSPINNPPLNEQPHSGV